MNHTLSLAKRELASFFFSPIAYVVMCLFMFVTAIIFVGWQFRPAEPAQMRVVFQTMGWLMIVVAPMISMGLMSEELRSGTIESLMTAPVSDWSVIVGKWLGAWAFLLVVLAPTLSFVVVLAIWADPDYGPIRTGYLGLMLVGGLYLAIGILASTLTRNQIIAFFVPFIIVLLLAVIMLFLPRFLPDWLVPVTAYLNVNQQFEDFHKGLIDTRNFVYFVSGIVLFLVLAVKALESRKWR